MKRARVETLKSIVLDGVFMQLTWRELVEAEKKLARAKKCRHQEMLQKMNKPLSDILNCDVTVVRCVVTQEKNTCNKDVDLDICCKGITYYLSRQWLICRTNPYMTCSKKHEDQFKTPRYSGSSNVHTFGFVEIPDYHYEIRECIEKHFDLIFETALNIYNKAHKE